jgi:hypothetical protein
MPTHASFRQSKQVSRSDENNSPTVISNKKHDIVSRVGPFILLSLCAFRLFARFVLSRVSSALIQPRFYAVVQSKIQIAWLYALFPKAPFLRLAPDTGHSCDITSGLVRSCHHSVLIHKQSRRSFRSRACRSPVLRRFPVLLRPPALLRSPVLFRSHVLHQAVQALRGRWPGPMAVQAHRGH